MTSKLSEHIAMSMPRKAGKSEYLRHLNGERLTRDEAIRAKCYECIGGEVTKPCKASTCPLIQYCTWNRSRSVHSEDEG